MTAYAPKTPAYRPPAADAIADAVDKVIAELRHVQHRIGRVMAVVTAAAVRDVLTGRDHDAPFDAAWVELVEHEDRKLFASGAYWTAAGKRRTFLDDFGRADGANAALDLNDWTGDLDDTNREVWEPISERLDDRRGRRVFRMDLAKAAALPLD
ncbi:hypothetical protein [Streptomyces sp. BH104]|uniref:hypothetical protein n=1 Tax=Streptomyces sp. BH104 TaxID=3410407 RepID=UPI003BB7F47C